MRRAFIGGKGGPFCQFTVGNHARGASSHYVRYIANRQAVRDGIDGVWLQGFPPLLLEVPYVVMVEYLCDWAHWMEQEDRLRQRGPGEVRTHYQAIVSFEVSVSTAQAKAMVAEWMQTILPLAQAAGFLHRNTQHLHVHLWIPARQTDGRKINLSPRAFRQIDEKWNAVYCRALNRDVREHLLKKEETKRYKQLRREGKVKEAERPERISHSWHPADFNGRERERLERALYDHNQAGIGGDQSTASKSASPVKAGEPGTLYREPAVTKESGPIQEALNEAHETVSQAHALHTDASRVVERQPKSSIALTNPGGEDKELKR